MNYNNFLQSKLFKRIVIGVGLLIIVLISFGAGILVGYNKARFSYAWGENYGRNFGGERHNILGIPAGPGFIGAPGTPPNPGPINAHGAFGTVLNTTSSSIAISGQDGSRGPQPSFLLQSCVKAVKKSRLLILKPVTRSLSSALRTKAAK